MGGRFTAETPRRRELHSPFLSVSLCLCGLFTARAAVVVLNGEAAQWEERCKVAQAECRFVALKDASDGSLAAFEKAVPPASGMIAMGASVPLAFYAASRLPHLFTAVVMVGGGATAALDSNRIFAANTKLVPVLWIQPAAPDVARLRAAEYSIETRAQGNSADVFGWLKQHPGTEFPPEVDCETGHKMFARCYWLRMTGFDPAKRNDALNRSRVPANLKARFDAKLDPGDKLIAIGGKPPEEYLDKVKDEGPASAMVERGKQRVRVEGQIVIPKAEETATARIQGSFNLERHELQLISRTVSGVELTLPPPWAPTALNWNGVDAAKLETAGCWSLTLADNAITVRKCQ